MLVVGLGPSQAVDDEAHQGRHKAQLAERIRSWPACQMRQLPGERLGLGNRHNRHVHPCRQSVDRNRQRHRIADASHERMLADANTAAKPSAGRDTRPPEKGPAFVPSSRSVRRVPILGMRMMAILPERTAAPAIGAQAVLPGG